MSVNTIVKQGRGGRWRWRDTLEGKTVAQGPVSGNATEGECFADRAAYEATLKRAADATVAALSKEVRDGKEWAETLKSDATAAFGKLKAKERELERVLNRSWLLVAIGLVVGAAAGAAVVHFLLG